MRGTRLFEFTGVARGHAFVLGDNNFSALVGQVKTRHFSTQTLGHKLHLRATVHQAEVVVHKEVCEYGFVVQANGTQQNRHRHLAAAIDAEIQQVFGVEFEIEP